MIVILGLICLCMVCISERFGMLCVCVLIINRLMLCILMVLKIWWERNSGIYLKWVGCSVEWIVCWWVRCVLIRLIFMVWF